MKTCSKCKVPKTEEEFYRFSKSPDGRQSRCKTCCAQDQRENPNNASYSAKYRAANPEACRARIREHQRKRRAGKPEECKAYVRKYYGLNKDRLNATRRAARLAKRPVKVTPTDKICSGCKVLKPRHDFFPRRDRGPFSVMAKCKECLAEKQRELQKTETFRAIARQRKKELYASSPEIREAIRVRSKIRCSLEGVKRARKARYPLVKDKLNAARRAERVEHPARVKARAHKYWEKNISKPQFKLAHTLRNRIRVALKQKSATKNVSSLELVGCSIPVLRSHLESLFKPGMTWENHGPVWHIDHIKPCSKFDLTDPKQQLACFNWSNLQPLFALENLSKGAKYEV